MAIFTRRLGWCCRAGLTVLRDLPRRCLVHVAVREGSSWSARSRVAARTNELDAAGRRRIIGRRGRVLRAGSLRVAWWSRCGWRSGLASTHPAFRRRCGGRHDHVSGDRAAQSCDRARPDGRLMPRGGRARSLVTLPVWAASWWSGCRAGVWFRRARCPGGLRVGEQVVGAGQELAGDRDGRDLLPAALCDGGVAGGELRRALGRLRRLVGWERCAWASDDRPPAAGGLCLGCIVRTVRDGSDR